LALVELSVVEQRYRAVLAVLAGETVVDVAAHHQVSRQSVHTWLSRYRADGLAGLADRSRRPGSCPHQAAPEVEAAVCELRREHPRWGPRRLVHELGRVGRVTPVPSRMTVHRILVRHNLIQAGQRRRKRSDYVRWERSAPMALWQIDIVGGIQLVDGTEVKVVTGVDDHSRFCVIAAVVPRATGRAVCLALVEALRRWGIPEEILTDNGKQFTDRFGRGGEVLFDRICRENAIVHRLTQPRSPTTTGKIERFHQSLRRELLDDHPPFESVLAVQAAVDTWVTHYNCHRPHQGIDDVYPAMRFAARHRNAAEDEALPLRVPAILAPADHPTVEFSPAPADAAALDGPVRDDVAAPPTVTAYRDGPVEFERVVPPSGNLGVRGKQFWLGPARIGQTITFWADHQLIHLLAGGTRIRTVRSHLSSADLATLAARGGRPAGPSPLPPPDPDTTALETDRTVNRSGIVTLGQQTVFIAEILAGRRVSVRIEPTLLLVFDPQTRELLRTRPNPLSWAQALRVQSVRPAGPPPRPRTEPVTVQRRVSASGVITVASQPVSLGRAHAGTVVTVHVSDTTLTVDTPDGQQRIYRRATDQPVRSIKAYRPRKVPHVS
jgi:transposase InsO family protein